MILPLLLSITTLMAGAPAFDRAWICGCPIPRGFRGVGVLGSLPFVAKKLLRRCAQRSLGHRLHHFPPIAVPWQGFTYAWAARWIRLLSGEQHTVVWGLAWPGACAI